ncbi:MAG: hypothetical protein KA282_05180, partial [Clostridia bacterium]|nr:hypothetical protein [Clostridia bacterium]
MRRYQKTYRIVQSVFISVSVILLLLIVVPILQFQLKSESALTFDLMGSKYNTSGADWVTNYYKMTQESGDPDLLFFRDISVVTEENANLLLGRAAIFEFLFNQESLNADTEKRLEYLTGASYSGFWGKSFENLSDRKAVPEEWIQQYEKENKTIWDLHGAGIIITDESSVIVLEQGKDYTKPMILKTENGQIPYYGSFEITSGAGTFEGEFSIDLTSSGASIFEEYGLPESFPAIYKIQRNLYDGYYFAGDFSQRPMDAPYEYEAMPWLLSHKGIYEKYSNEEVYWKAYRPFVGKMITELESRKQSGLTLIAEKPSAKSVFSADTNQIYREDTNGKGKFFIKGVNLGAALPGKAFTEFPQDKDTYYEWMTEMASLNMNTLRVYTLLPPVFYQALYEYNIKHPDQPLYLMQEIWPEEKPEGNNYLNAEYNETYQQEIQYDIRAIHGDIAIPERSYRSWGIYAYDVSPYLLGYLVGRELEPEEVLRTDELNEGYRYQGQYVYSEAEASPTEAWLAESCDFALSIEDELYENKPLAAIVSWPTLDSLEHNSEWNPAGDKSLQYNDKAVVNIDHMGINRDKVSGFFGAYHIYPNYPDFMNNDVEYDAYKDEQGRFRYGGYLNAFIAQHQKY